VRSLVAFLLGFLLCAGLAAGGYFLLLPRLQLDPCQACGVGTRCEAGTCVATAAPPPAPQKRRSRPPRSPRSEEERPQIVLKPGDLKPATVGDNLARTEVIDLTRDEGGERELSQDDIDRVFQPAQSSIVACIDEARGEADLAGRMTVSFRIQRSGQVSGVRLEAPSYLVHRGLYGCVRPVVLGLRFPPSSRGQVVSYPFTLR
jgi:hypothetical protein